MRRRPGAGLLAAALLAPAALSQAPPFADVTDRAGIRFVHRHGGEGRRYLPETMGAGGCALDYDRDGSMDLYLVQSGSLLAGGEAGGALLRNRGDGTFEDTTAPALAAVAAYGQGAVCADADGDGETDLYITAVGANVLLRNRGDGTFEDATAAAGVGDEAWGASATFFDADRDGDLDLYVANYLAWTPATHRDCWNRTAGETQYCHPDLYPFAADAFFRNRGGGRFEHAEEAAGLVDRDGKGLGVVAFDADGDGWIDLYVANDSTPNFLFHNQGGGRFREVGLEQGVAVNDAGRTEAGMGVDAGDADGDGGLDLIVTNLSLEANALYLSSGSPGGGYRYATRRAGLYEPSLRVLGFGVHWIDVDLDVDLDLLVINGDVLDNVELINDGLRHAQPAQLFVNDGQARFLQLPPHRLGDLAAPRVGRGSLLLDADHDGRLDLVVSSSGDRARLYHNQMSGNHWLGIALAGRAPNTGALGARVTVLAGGRQQVAEVRAGSSYLTSSDPRLFFGLGEARAAERVTVRWPSGERQVFRHLEAGAILVLSAPRGGAR